MLTHLGIIAEQQLENLKGANSRKNISTDLLVLVCLLQDDWQKIEGKSHTTLADLEHAKLLVTGLQTILGLNEQGQGVVAADRRRRACTRLLVAYEAVQRAVAYLRAARYDVETIVPNLHPGRPGARRVAEEEAPVAPPAATGPNTAPVAAPKSPAALAPAGFDPDGPFMPK